MAQVKEGAQVEELVAKTVIVRSHRPNKRSRLALISKLQKPTPIPEFFGEKQRNRLELELAELHTEGFQVCFAESNNKQIKWQVKMVMPRGKKYMLNVEFGSLYPFQMPELSFERQSSLINSTDLVNLSHIMQCCRDQWSAVTTVADICKMIRNHHLPGTLLP